LVVHLDAAALALFGDVMIAEIDLTLLVLALVGAAVGVRSWPRLRRRRRHRHPGQKETRHPNGPATREHETCSQKSRPSIGLKRPRRSATGSRAGARDGPRACPA